MGGWFRWLSSLFGISMNTPHIPSPKNGMPLWWCWGYSIACIKTTIQNYDYGVVVCEGHSMWGPYSTREKGP